MSENLGEYKYTETMRQVVIKKIKEFLKSDYYMDGVLVTWPFIREELDYMTNNELLSVLTTIHYLKYAK